MKKLIKHAKSVPWDSRCNSIAITINTSTCYEFQLLKVWFDATAQLSYTYPVQQHLFLVFLLLTLNKYMLARYWLVHLNIRVFTSLILSEGE